MPEGPLVPESCPAPPNGTVALQWRLQDGSWQDPSSWSVFATSVVSFHPTVCYTQLVVAHEIGTGTRYQFPLACTRPCCVLCLVDLLLGQVEGVYTGMQRGR